MSRAPVQVDRPTVDKSVEMHALVHVCNVLYTTSSACAGVATRESF